MGDSTVIYHGLPGSNIVVVETRDGDCIGVVAHLHRHSPTGFSWGYAGSGPADLARSLLVAAVGDAARCRVCSGMGCVELLADGTKQPATSSSEPEAIVGCLGCDEGSLIVPEVYQRFKFDVVAQLDDEWRITQEDVLRWWSHHNGLGTEGRYA